MSYIAKAKPWLLPVAFPFVLFCALTWLYISPSGTREITWRAGESSALIGRPLPDNRTEEACEDSRGSCIATIDEPLYMSITPPAGLWHEMQVVITYDLHDQEKFALGLVQDFATQSFVLLPLASGESAEGWSVGAATFSLENVQKENGAYKLILSLPGVETVAQKPTIHSTSVRFIRNTSVIGEIKWFIKGLWTDRP
jgi:hypothetical protein